MGIANRAVRGMLWAYTVFFGSRLVTIVSTAILARLLVPADFGLIGYALLLLNFVEAARDLGIKDALIYSSERLEDTADTAFILNAALGFLQFALVFALAPLALHVMADPRLVLLLRVMGLVFIFNGLGNTHDGLLQKDLEFRKRYTPDVYSAVIKGLVSIGMAALGYGVWSLAAGHVVGSIVRMGGKWLLQPWRPRLRFFPDRARSLWDYGAHILLFSLLGIALDQADQLFVGTLLGEIQLGYYTIAARIPEMVLINFSLVLTMVLFPTYARIKNDGEKLSRGFLLTAKYTSFVTLPVGLGLVAVAPELVQTVFGRQWEPAVILMQVLALLSMTVTLPWPVGDLFKALGRPDISTKLLAVEALYTFPLVALFTAGSRLAVMASLANLIAAVITAALRLGVASRFLKLNPLEYYFTFRGGFFGGAVMFGTVLAWRAALPTLSPLLYLLTAIPLGVVVYGAVLWVLEKKDLLIAFDLLLRALGRRTDVEAESAP